MNSQDPQNMCRSRFGNMLHLLYFLKVVILYPIYKTGTFLVLRDGLRDGLLTNVKQYIYVRHCGML